MRALLMIFILTSFFLSSCGSSELTFSEILNKNVSNIAKITSYSDMPGNQRVIIDKAKIKQFINIMESTKYSKAKPFGSLTGGSIVLYNNKNVHLADITSWKGIYKINSHYYQPTNKIEKQLGAFFEELKN